MMETSRAAITGVGRCLPSQIVSSVDVEARVTSTGEGFAMPKGLVRLVTGVENRRYASDTAASSDLAAAAGTDALEMAGIHPLDVDTLIFASASHDVSEPATANIVQTKCACSNASVFDLKNACNSFVNALDVAASLVATARAATVLVVAGEVLSPTINWEISSTEELSRRFAALTLGDAGAACVIEAVPPSSVGQIFPATTKSMGEHWELSTILAGGTLYRHDMTHRYFECDSTSLQHLAVSELPKLVNETLARVGWDLAEVDRVMPHQVSRGVIERIADELDYPRERCEVTIDRFGNTAAASIPLALASAHIEGRLAYGDKLLLIGGAAGFSGAVLPLVWSLESPHTVPDPQAQPLNASSTSTQWLNPISEEVSDEE